MPPHVLRTSRVNVQEWCVSISRQLPGRWTTMPYNRFESDDCPWWISSISDNPAYAAAKVSFRREKGQYRVGLLIEKGVDAAMKGIHAKKSEVMTPRWAWHRGLTHVAGSDFDTMLHALHAFGAVQLDLTVATVSGWSDVRSARYDWDGACFTRQSAVGGHLHHMPEKLVMMELPGLVAAIPDLAWKWIDLYVELPVLFDPQATPQSDAELAQCVVAPLADLARRLTRPRR